MSIRNGIAPAAPLIALPVTARPGVAVRDTVLERALPSGRSLLVTRQGMDEALEIRSPRGTIEVRIAFGEAGPVVTVAGASRLEVAAPDVAVACRTFDVRASDEVRLAGRAVAVAGEQQVDLASQGDVRVDGARILLNCDRDVVPPEGTD